MKIYAPTKISENMRETPEGFLVCLAVPIARTGAMEYDKSELPLTPGPDGKIQVSRNEDELFHPRTIGSFEGKPFTITHPVEDVTPDNWKELAKGEIINVRRGEGEWSDSLLADIYVKDKVAIDLIKNGLREVSCGYNADWVEDDEKPGIGWVENIYGNHLALVDQGRAGSSYAINDSKKGVGRMVFTDKVKEKFKNVFMSKGLDEAMKAVDAEVKAEGEQSQPVPATGAPAKAIDGLEDLKKGMDAMQKSMDALCAKIGGQKSGDAGDPEAVPAAKTGDEEVAPSMEDRMKSLEAAVAKLLENAAVGDEEGEESDMGDEDGEEEDADDDDFEESSMVGDAAHKAAGRDEASRAEILAPGIKPGKDLKARALKAAYATKDGRRAIEAFTGKDKAPDFKSAEKVDMVFRGASELLKTMRNKNLSAARRAAGEGRDAGDPISKPMSADELNKKNEEYWSKKSH